ncbi:MAG: phosphoribosylanthranilate isomerase [Deltaproteobacteria bacterium]|nr:phosphoribosylanthranilate isomerase [Deltaproteobacteria bacterium]MBW2019174.1 phosphoribosylanthranilate isomerase [Deltaproteobacteria bacterium]MBW2073977.1 phosphoribosylanthranilate isomerase [Deltaproteobacteria bacterium]
MAKITVQIYEIQDPREAEAVIELGVDRIGSVILSKENWKVPAIREAIGVSRGTRVKHSLIPLFHTKEVLFQALEYYQPDIIHFCDSLTYDDGRIIPCEPFVELQISLKERFPGIEIMRSVPIATPESSERIPTLEIARHFQDASDYFLTDTWFGKEPVEGYIGITGRTCDWAVARKLVALSPIPVILAGGLSPENVYKGVMVVKPFGVDSCTGTNALDNSGKPIRFKKDYEKVKAFVKEARRAEKDLFGCQNITRNGG